ncbi:M1 family metallopeptidase [Myroides sp. JBRI-B21084]|uniref:M1 family metallopeptidase n=1 Tax=Myroides sp. JBRI-B21084 TaxID=3119977 RepID=UPI0026E2A57F|nr:M1 family metallopeptidase [Paenimyroides cloacae]WKW45949.1 M1 family metallopeptidase [Paenimyroides cloacae]
MKKLIFLLFTVSVSSYAQHKNPNPGYWQQHVDYKMDVTMDVEKFQYSGTQELVYTNNSNDTLKKVFCHLYFNAFKPGSEMDARLTSISDPDKRMVKSFKGADGIEKKQSKIAELKPTEIGFLNVVDLKQDGVALKNKVVGTILEVELAKPLLPKAKTTFTMKFNGQVPVMVRRAGRNSEEGVALSMTQWYPKMAEFDFEGWHADPYIGREFHGVWGNFDVKLTLDKNYTVGATGYLQNKNEIGHGYQDAGVNVSIPKKQKTLTWHFVAPNVHDFAWGADPNFIHDKVLGANNVELHFFYKNDPSIIENWKKLQPETVKLLDFFNKNIGNYPYKQYSVIQGGDGGMEYAMCTLITGKRSLPSLIGVTAHEMAHMWFQHLLATNESKHEWMDEGFTSFISDFAVNQIMDKKNQEDENPFQSAYNGYYYMVKKNGQQPLSTHADRYSDNMNYGISAYNKGSVFITQLAYVIGWDKTLETLKRFYHDFSFSHPTPNDFKRTAERVSGAVLDWYLVDWTQTTNTIDYGVKNVEVNQNQVNVTLERIGQMPMPLDVLVIYEDESSETFYIPNTLMRYTKANPYPNISRTVLNGWDWAYETYNFKFDTKGKKMKTLVIDPTQLMADVNKANNSKDF